MPGWLLIGLGVAGFIVATTGQAAQMMIIGVMVVVIVAVLFSMRGNRDLR